MRLCSAFFVKGNNGYVQAHVVLCNTGSCPSINQYVEMGLEQVEGRWVGGGESGRHGRCCHLPRPTGEVTSHPGLPGFPALGMDGATPSGNYLVPRQTRTVGPSYHGLRLHVFYSVRARVIILCHRDAKCA